MLLRVPIANRRTQAKFKAIEQNFTRKNLSHTGVQTALSFAHYLPIERWAVSVAHPSLKSHGIVHVRHLSIHTLKRLLSVNGIKAEMMTFGQFIRGAKIHDCTSSLNIWVEGDGR